MSPFDWLALAWPWCILIGTLIAFSITAAQMIDRFERQNQA